LSSNVEMIRYTLLETNIQKQILLQLYWALPACRPLFVPTFECYQNYKWEQKRVQCDSLELQNEHKE
jgi:hypothetical protein